MNFEHLGDTSVALDLVTARKIPCDGHFRFCERFEHHGVAFLELRGREPASVRVVDVWICASLVEHDVAVRHLGEHERKTLAEELWNLIARHVAVTTRKVANPTLGTQEMDDVVSAVAVVHVEIK